MDGGVFLSADSFSPQVSRFLYAAVASRDDPGAIVGTGYSGDDKEIVSSKAVADDGHVGAGCDIHFTVKKSLERQFPAWVAYKGYLGSHFPEESLGVCNDNQAGQCIVLYSDSDMGEGLFGIPPAGNRQEHQSERGAEPAECEPVNAHFRCN